MKKNDFDTSALQSKSWNEFATADARYIDIVITVCDSAAAKTCPIWLGSPISAHWRLPDSTAIADPAEIVKKTFEATHERLSKRIRKLLKLPISEPGSNELKMEIAKIGQIKD